MKRRDFVRLGWATMIATGAGKLRPAFGKSPGLQQVPGPPQHLMAPLEPKATEACGGFHPANRAHDGRAGPAGCNQHNRLQQ